jgi:hypothetical protein
MRSSSWSACTAVAVALVTAVLPVAAAAEPGEGITIETSEGPVTCAVDPAHEPGPEAITTTPLAHGARIVISETGALRCQTPMFGDVEVTATGLPWRLKLNERHLLARLRGTPKPGLLVKPVLLPSLACVYQAGTTLGTLTAGSQPSLSLTVKRVRLNKRFSSGLCPALGPVDLALTLP